jgi:DNA-binding SARP family transcriptional activator/predicted ATPase
MPIMSRLELAFLGTFQVTLNGQPVARFRSANNQGLLVYLALNGDRPIARELLVALLWPEESDHNAHNNLRQAIFQLRQLLGDTESSATPHLLVTRQVVQFNPAGDHALDVAQFLRAIESHDLDTAAEHYRGELLPGFNAGSAEFEEWLRLEREQLHRLALEAMFEAARDHLAAGRLDKAQALARRQLSLEPWREPAHRQLMQAYALAGDRAAALAQYEMCREVLWTELGIEPAPETAALLEEIKAGRYSRMATDETIRPPERTRHNLPIDTTPFIGREVELAEIGRLLVHERRRLVTIVAPGGMGKTRLALAVGRSVLAQFADGVYFVDLAPVERPEDIAPAIAAALEFKPPDPLLELTPQLLAFLSRRNLLLILDNFEQVLAGAALVSEILRHCPNVAVLVTSRERLNLTSESRYELGGLDYPSDLSPDDALGYTAVRLFVDSGRRVRADFDLTGDNLADVIRVCRLVRGMPLGLILAAGWLALLTPAEIAAEIERGLEFLAADLADLPERQRSMRAVFDRSWRALSPEEQAVMARLSIFRGGFTREAAEQVAGANLRVLLALVNKSLLQRHPNGRFDVHELLRQYAAEQRRQDDPDGLVELAHCREFARLADTEMRQSSFQPFATERLAAEPDNIRRAWAYAVEHAMAKELVMLSWGIYSLGMAEGSHHKFLLEQAWQSLQQSGLPDTHPDMLRLRLNLLISMWGFEANSHVKDLALELVPLVEENGDLELRFRLYLAIAGILEDLNDIEALNWSEKAIQVALETGDESKTTQARANELMIRVNMGRGAGTGPTELEALLTYFESKNQDYFYVSWLLLTLTTYCLSLHNYDRAIYYGKCWLNLAKSLRHLYMIGGASEKLTEIHLQMGLSQEAAGHILDNLEWHLAIGKVWQTLGAIFSVLAHFSPLFGGGKTAVPILSMVYHHPEAIPLYREGIAAALPSLEVEMGAAAYAAAWERGKTLDFDTAVAQMRSILSGDRI